MKGGVALHSPGAEQESILHLMSFRVGLSESESRSVVCDPVDCTVHGILQARILGWVAFPFSRGSSQTRDRIQVSCVAGGFFTS